VRFQASLSDTFWSEARNQFLSCNTNCRNIIVRIDVRREWSGFSAFNGTYEIPFYAYNLEDEIWEEADPTVTACGVWFYPRIDADITFTETYTRSAIPVDFYGTYNDTGCITEYRQTIRTLRVGMETRSGEMYVVNPVADYVGFGGSFGSGLGTPYPPLDPAVLQKRKTLEWFDCWSGLADDIESQNLDAGRPWVLSPLSGVDPLGWGLKPIQGASLFNIDGQSGLKTIDPFELHPPLGVRWYFSQEIEPRRSTAYDFSVYPYGGPGFPQSSTRCDVRTERVLKEIFANEILYDQAYFDEYAPGTNTLQQCNPAFPLFSSSPVIPGPYPVPPYRFAHAGFTSDFRVLLN
jgi:hypothetical protein